MELKRSNSVLERCESLACFFKLTFVAVLFVSGPSCLRLLSLQSCDEDLECLFLSVEAFDL